MFRRRIMYFVLHFCVGRWHIGLVSYIDISDTFQVGGWEAGKLPVQVHPTTFHIVRQGPAVLAACAERVGCFLCFFFFCFFFHLRYPIFLF